MHVIQQVTFFANSKTVWTIVQKQSLETNQIFFDQNDLIGIQQPCHYDRYFQ